MNIWVTKMIYQQTELYMINRYIYIIKILDTARPCSEKDKMVIEILNSYELLISLQSADKLSHMMNFYTT